MIKIMREARCGCGHSWHVTAQDLKNVKCSECIHKKKILDMSWYIPPVKHKVHIQKYWAFKALW